MDRGRGGGCVKKGSRKTGYNVKGAVLFVVRSRFCVVYVFVQMR